MKTKTLKPLQDHAISGDTPLLWIDFDPARARDLWEEADYRLSAVCCALSELAGMTIRDGSSNAVPNIAAALSLLAEDARAIHHAAHDAFVAKKDREPESARDGRE